MSRAELTIETSVLAAVEGKCLCSREREVLSSQGVGEGRESRGALVMEHPGRKGRRGVSLKGWGEAFCSFFLL